jgi:hypothetical protein
MNKTKNIFNSQNQKNMKKIIVMSLTILSVGLFSFTLPKPSASGVWLMSDGNYSIDQGAMQQNFTPADQASVNKLLGDLYNLDMNKLDGSAELAPIVDATTKGSSYASKYPWFWVFYSKIYKWDNAQVAPPGSEGDQLVQILNQYAQPLP